MFSNLPENGKPELADCIAVERVVSEETNLAQPAGPKTDKERKPV